MAKLPGKGNFLLETMQGKNSETIAIMNQKMLWEGRKKAKILRNDVNALQAAQKVLEDEQDSAPQEARAIVDNVKSKAGLTTNPLTIDNVTVSVIYAGDDKKSKARAQKVNDKNLKLMGDLNKHVKEIAKNTKQVNDQDTDIKKDNKEKNAFFGSLNKRLKDNKAAAEEESSGLFGALTGLMAGASTAMLALLGGTKLWGAIKSLGGLVLGVPKKGWAALKSFFNMFKTDVPKVKKWMSGVNPKVKALAGNGDILRNTEKRQVFSPKTKLVDKKLAVVKSIVRNKTALKALAMSLPMVPTIMATLLNPATWIAVGAVALGYGIGAIFGYSIEDVNNKIWATLEYFGELGSDTWKMLKKIDWSGLGSIAWEGIKSFGAGVLEGALDMTKKIDSVLGISAFVGFVGSINKYMINGVVSLWDWVRDAAENTVMGRKIFSTLDEMVEVWHEFSGGFDKMVDRVTEAAIEGTKQWFSDLFKETTGWWGNYFRGLIGDVKQFGEDNRAEVAAENARTLKLLEEFDKQAKKGSLSASDFKTYRQTTMEYKRDMAGKSTFKRKIYHEPTKFRADGKTTTLRWDEWFKQENGREPTDEDKGTLLAKAKKVGTKVLNAGKNTIAKANSKLEEITNTNTPSITKVKTYADKILGSTVGAGGTGGLIDDARNNYVGKYGYSQQVGRRGVHMGGADAGKLNQSSSFDCSSFVGHMVQKHYGVPITKFGTYTKPQWEYCHNSGNAIAVKPHEAKAGDIAFYLYGEVSKHGVGLPSHVVIISSSTHYIHASTRGKGGIIESRYNPNAGALMGVFRLNVEGYTYTAPTTSTVTMPPLGTSDNFHIPGIGTISTRGSEVDVIHNSVTDMYQQISDLKNQVLNINSKDKKTHEFSGILDVNNSCELIKE